MESGGTWRMTQLLGHIVPKKSTPIIRLINTSSLCAKLGETN
jgi:hypothetical protein